MNTTDIVRVLLSERTKLLGFIRSVLGSREGIEDIFQDVCLLALVKADTINDEQHLSSWLRIACRHLCREALRKRGQAALPLGDAVLDLLEKHWSKRDGGSATDVFDALTLCVGELTAKSQELVRLRYVIDLTVGEISERLNRSNNSVYVTFSRIHAALADCVSNRIHERRLGHG